MAEETQNVEQEAVQEEEVQPTEDQANETSEAPFTTEVADDGTIKVDLRNLNEETNAVQEQSPDEVPVRDESETSEPVQEQNNEQTNEEPSGESEAVDQKDSVLELVQDEEVEEATLADKIKDIPNKLKEESESVNNNQETNDLPENINKLIEFMEETGGTLEDYVSLNKDYDSMADTDLLREHYRQTKPHLDEEEISFLIEDNFSYDEDVDEERDIRRKKLALKESIAEAKSSLTGLKDKYYSDLKLSSKLSPEQSEAIEFYNDYKAGQENAQQQRNIFEQKTNELFTNEFKGFEYKVGDNKYRFKVKDVDNVKSAQNDINSLVSKFVDENNNMQDAAGYHKALFTAMNADAIANHFYEQGKADAIRSNMAKSKNIDMGNRGAHEKVTTNSGFKVRAISGDDFDSLRVKIKN